MKVFFTPLLEIIEQKHPIKLWFFYNSLFKSMLFIDVFVLYSLHMSAAIGSSKVKKTSVSFSCHNFAQSAFLTFVDSLLLSLKPLQFLICKCCLISSGILLSWLFGSIVKSSFLEMEFRLFKTSVVQNHTRGRSILIDIYLIYI